MGQASVSGVEPLPFGTRQGAALRVGGRPERSESFVGDSQWRTLRAEFEVAEAIAEVELICELRARAGEAWFDRDSLRVVRIGNL